jgi:hypothetical protein
MQISPLGSWLVSALSISIGEIDSIPLLTLTLITITSMQLLHKQASTLYQERAVFGKLKMDPAKRAQTQNAGDV